MLISARRGKRGRVGAAGVRVPHQERGGGWRKPRLANDGGKEVGKKTNRHDHGKILRMKGPPIGHAILHTTPIHFPEGKKFRSVPTEGAGSPDAYSPWRSAKRARWPPYAPVCSPYVLPRKRLSLDVRIRLAERPCDPFPAHAGRRAARPFPRDANRDGSSRPRGTNASSWSERSETRDLSRKELGDHGQDDPDRDQDPEDQRNQPHDSGGSRLIRRGEVRG